MTAAGTTLPRSVHTIVVGAGVHGLSAAYHLAEERGRGDDVLVLEKRRVGAGASGISGGIVRNFYLSPGMNEVVRQSVEIFELDPGGFGFRQVGYIAAVPESQEPDVERIAWQHEHVGYESELVLGAGGARAHMRELFGDWRASGVTAVLHEKQGGWAQARATVDNLAGMARSLGVRIVEGVAVTGFELEGDVVRGVETSAARVECDLVVVAPGPWARDIWTMLELPAEIELRDGLVPMFHYWKVREGEYALPGGGRLDPRDPVVHLDLDEPLLSDDDGRELDPGPWGVYFRPGLDGAVQGGGLPAALAPDCELDPYGPSHPDHGAVEGGFDEWFTSGLATALGRFRGCSPLWRASSFGAQTCFTPDSYPIVDFVRSNVYAVLDSNHGFKMLALGRLAAEDILRGPAPDLEPFRLGRFAEGMLHPVSASPYPWN